MNEFQVGDVVFYAGEKAIITLLGTDARGWGLANLRLTGRRSVTVYLSAITPR